MVVPVPTVRSTALAVGVVARHWTARAILAEAATVRQAWSL
jgi:hypothetical protein